MMHEEDELFPEQARTQPREEKGEEKGQENGEATWDDQPKSKSQRKRELHALLALTEKALTLPEEKLEATGLDEKVLRAFKEAKKMKASGARNRQIKYISKLIRNEDLDVLEKYLAEAANSNENEKRFFHQLEKWRDRLLANGDTAVNECIEQFPGLDRQQLRALVRQANRESELAKAPVAARKLFKLLRAAADAKSFQSYMKD